MALTNDTNEMADTNGTNEMAETNENLVEIPPSIYFGNTGCGAAFTIGVIHAMKKYWGDDFQQKTLLCGDNTGAILAMQLAMGQSSHHIEMVARSIFRRMRLDSRIFSGQNFWLNQYIDHVMSTKTELYKEFNEKGVSKYQCGTTSLSLGTTFMGFSHQWHKTWIDNTELGNCLKGSTNIPLFCDFFSELVEGRVVLDGSCSFSGKDLPHGNDTLFVGMNVEEAGDISYEMSYYRICVPGDQTEFNFLFKEGVKAFEKWTIIPTKRKKKVLKMQPNYTMVILCWMGKYIQFFYEYVVREILNE